MFAVMSSVLILTLLEYTSPTYFYREEPVKNEPVPDPLDKQWTAHVKACVEAYEKDNTGWMEYEIHFYINNYDPFDYYRFQDEYRANNMKKNHCYLGFYKINKGWTKENTYYPDEGEIVPSFTKEFYLKPVEAKKESLKESPKFTQCSKKAGEVWTDFARNEEERRSIIRDNCTTVEVKAKQWNAAATP